MLLIMICMISFKCKKDSTDPFCNINRQTYFSFPATEGTVGYSDKYQRFVVIFQVNDSTNIDESIVGFPCELTKELQVVGKKVILSGTLKTFNSDENMTPEIGGQNLYFLDLSTINPKQ